MSASRVSWWVPAAGVLLAVHAVVSLTWQKSFALTVFGNITQTALLTIAFFVMWLNVRPARGSVRGFWMLMTVGCGMWLAAQVLWTWFELVLRREVPNPFLGDVIFFLHVVPMMGALALRPHLDSGQRRLRLGSVDFLLLLLWWVYLYLLLVIPWQYVTMSLPLYGFSFNVLYDVEKMLFLAVLGALWVRTEGPWKSIYAHLFGAACLYMIASQYINLAIDAETYFTGSLLDVPLAGSMAWFVWAGLRGHKLAPGGEVAAKPGPHREIWPSWLAMAALLSIPPLMAWAHFVSPAPVEVRNFRLLVSLLAVLVLAFLVFLKQHLLDQELLRLLRASEESLENQKRLQGELIRSEKLASLGRLVAGAAHEINNPLTAILGYADMLSSDSSLAETHRTLAEKIRQQARRTRELVGNLISFSRQAPGEKVLVNVNSVVTNAVKLRQPELGAKNIFLELQAKPGLPGIVAHEQQLLQVCLQLISNAADAMGQQGGGLLMVRTRQENKQVVLEFSDTGPGVRDPQYVFDPFYTTKPVGKGSGLGLSAAYGIIEEHNGQIVCLNRPEGGATFLVMLPVGEAPKPAAAPAPAASAEPARKD